MEAYLGYLNITLNAPQGIQLPHTVDIKDIYNKIEIKKIRKPNNKILKGFSIDSVEVCSASRGCTPKKRIVEKDTNKHLNYLTLYKNKNGSIKTDKNIPNWINTKGKQRTNYVLLNVKATCLIGDAIENVAIRVPKSGAIGVKIGLSTQTEIEVKDPKGDNKIERLKYELERVVYEMIPVKAKRPSVLSGLTVNGYNLSNPGTGERPDHRIENFITSMRELDKEVGTHFMDYEPSESKTLPRVNFRSKTNGPTVGITKWLMVDFTGCRSLAQVRTIMTEFSNGFMKIQKSIKWNMNHAGAVPKSRRKTKKTENNVKNKANNNPNNINIPVWNKNKQKYIQKGKIFDCMKLKKPDLVKLAKKVDVNPDGFKKELCSRIILKLKK